MTTDQNLNDWHLQADRFSFYGDVEAIKRIPDQVLDEEIQKYLYAYHNDAIPLQEIHRLRFVHSPIEQE